MDFKRIDNVPPGTFPSANFMTSVVVCHYRLASGQYVEVSRPQGDVGMAGTPIRGVTIRPDPHNWSTLVHGRITEVESYLRGLGEQDE